MILQQFFYPFNFDIEDSDDIYILQYFFMHGIGLFIKLNSYVAHMFYTWSFGHNTEVTTEKYHLSLNSYGTVFAWCGGNINKIENI